MDGHKWVSKHHHKLQIPKREDGAMKFLISSELHWKDQVFHAFTQSHDARLVLCADHRHAGGDVDGEHLQPIGHPAIYRPKKSTSSNPQRCWSGFRPVRDARLTLLQMEESLLLSGFWGRRF